MKHTNDLGGTPVDELTLMRLVDGEAASAERIKIIERLERQPGGWRDCALAFLEDQAWRQAMSAPSAMGASADRAGMSEVSLLPVDESSEKTSNPRSWMNLAATVALAAGLFLAFAAGRQMRDDARDGAAKIAVSPQSPAAAPLAPTAKDNSQPNIAQPFFAENAADAPLYVIDKEFWEHETSVPQDFQKKLESIGARVERKRGLMPVRANDGREWIVPYEELNVVPVRDVSL